MNGERGNVRLQAYSSARDIGADTVIIGDMNELSIDDSRRWPASSAGNTSSARL